MLENLDTIDWRNLHHAYGPANDVPDLIRALVSNDEEERQSAIFELYGNIWHQDTVYEATAYAVPFLIELLESERAQDKDEILGLLAALANGSSSPALYQKQAHDAVARGVKVYVTLLDHDDPEVRIGVLYMLSSLPECASEVLPILKGCLEFEQNRQVRASLFLGMGSFSADQLQQYSQLFQDSIMAESEAPLVKLAAAIALIRSTGADHTLSPEAMQTVIEAIMHPEELEPAYEVLPWMHSGFGDDISMILCNLPPAIASAALSLCLEALAQENYWSTVDVISTLLFFIFDSVAFGFMPGNQGPTGHPLTEAQSTVLETLVACDQLWQNNANMAAIMKECNIPGGREQLRACLENAHDA